MIHSLRIVNIWLTLSNISEAPTAEVSTPPETPLRLQKRPLPTYDHPSRIELSDKKPKISSLVAKSVPSEHQSQSTPKMVEIPWASSKGKTKARQKKIPKVIIKNGDWGDGETVECGDKIGVYFSIRLQDGTVVEDHIQGEPVRRLVPPCSFLIAPFSVSSRSRERWSHQRCHPHTLPLPPPVIFSWLTSRLGREHRRHESWCPQTTYHTTWARVWGRQNRQHSGK